MNRSAEELVLTGLDGANPLGFLAALGALRILADAWSQTDVRLAWVPAGAWRPALSARRPLDFPSLAGFLHKHMPSSDSVQFTLAAGPRHKPEPTLRITPACFRHLAARARAAGVRDRTVADFLACWGSDAAGDSERIAETAFQFTSGNQRFLEMVREIVTDVTADNLREAVEGPWRYGDGGSSLRWDPLDETRQYALQAINPAKGDKNPIRVCRGANRLAIEGLPLLPLVPARPYPATTLVSHTEEDQVMLWPLWTAALTCDGVRMLLGNGEWRDDPVARAARGVTAVYRARIVKPSGRYRNFAPAQPL